MILKFFSSLLSIPAARQLALCFALVLAVKYGTKFAAYVRRSVRGVK